MRAEDASSLPISGRHSQEMSASDSISDSNRITFPPGSSTRTPKALYLYFLVTIERVLTTAARSEFQCRSGRKRSLRKFKSKSCPEINRHPNLAFSDNFAVSFSLFTQTVTQSCGKAENYELRNQTYSLSFTHGRNKLNRALQHRVFYV